LKKQLLRQPLDKFLPFKNRKIINNIDKIPVLCSIAEHLKAD